MAHLLEDLEVSFGERELFRQGGVIRAFESICRLQGESVTAFVRRFRLLERKLQDNKVPAYPEEARVVKLLDGLKLDERATASLLLAAGNRYDMKLVQEAIRIQYPPGMSVTGIPNGGASRGKTLLPRGNRSGSSKWSAWPSSSSWSSWQADSNNFPEYDTVPTIEEVPEEGEVDAEGDTNYHEDVEYQYDEEDVLQASVDHEGQPRPSFVPHDQVHGVIRTTSNFEKFKCQIPKKSRFFTVTRWDRKVRIVKCPSKQCQFAEL